MRILHTLPGLNWGGMEHRALEQTRWQLERGHDVILAAPPGGEPAQRALAMGLPFEPLIFDRPYSPSTVLGLRALVRRHRPQVIDAHGGKDGKCAGTCLGLCAVVRDRHVTQTLRTSFTRRLQWRLGCDHVIAVAGLIRDGLLKARLVAPERISVVGEWAENRFFAPPPDSAHRSALRSSLGLGDSMFVTAVVGMLRPDKGQDVLIRATARLRAGGHDAACLLVGAPTPESVDYAESLRRLAQELGLESRAVFAGYREDIPDIMALADAVAVPTETMEAQSRVVPQAFACSRPVVASMVGGLTELVHAPETGWLVPPSDPEALAQALAEIASNPAQAKQAAANARAFADSHLRFDGKMEETLAIYAKAIDRAAKRHATFI